MPEAESLFSETSQYLKSEDVAQLKNAYVFGQGAHFGQFRKSGEPYISHPLAVATILSKLHLDVPTLTAALLHDVVEDTDISKAEISERFGEPVAELVDGGLFPLEGGGLVGLVRFGFGALSGGGGDGREGDLKQFAAVHEDSLLTNS